MNWQSIIHNPALMSIISLFGYHVLAAFVDALEMPDVNSSKLYRFVFTFTNSLAANYSRAKASGGPAGMQPPK